MTTKETCHGIDPHRDSGGVAVRRWRLLGTAAQPLVGDRSSMRFRDLRSKRRRFASLAPVLLLLSGCGGADPDCNSEDTRASVTKAISGDSNNPLVDYAVKNSEALKKKVNAASSEAERSAITAKARQSAVYRL